jgi:hypothetical protein
MTSGVTMRERGAPTPRPLTTLPVEEVIMAARTLTQDRLKEVLDYDPATGVFTWIKPRNGVTVGDEAGGLSKDGYRHLCLDKKQWKSHRLAWLYVHGEWPKGEIDHINRVRDDNRMENLRVVTPQQNKMNHGGHKRNRSGITGVCWIGYAWRAFIGNEILINSHDFFEACCARKSAENRFWND